MKKVIAILLLIIYTTATFGFSIKRFYCCGKLKSVSFVINQNTKANCKIGNEKNGCCENKYLTLKVKDNYIATVGLVNSGKHFIDFFTFTSFYQSPDFTRFQQIKTFVNPGDAPPLHDGVPVYILNCTYRI